MSQDLRSNIIKLAYQNPELRDQLLPLVSESQSRTAGAFEDDIKGKKFRNPATGNQVTFKSLPAEEQTRIRKQWQSSQKGEGKETTNEKPAEGVKTPSWMGDALEGLHKDYDQTRDALKPINYALANGKPVTDKMVKELADAANEEYQHVEKNGATSEGARKGYDHLKKILNWALGQSQGHLREAPKPDKPAKKPAKPSTTNEKPAPKPKAPKSKGLNVRNVMTPRYEGPHASEAKQIAKDYNLKDDDLDDLADWRRGRPEGGKKLSWDRLKLEFLKGAKDPKQRERMLKMTPNEFKAMYLSIVHKDDMEGAED